MGIDEQESKKLPSEGVDQTQSEEKIKKVLFNLGKMMLAIKNRIDKHLPLNPDVIANTRSALENEKIIDRLTPEMYRGYREILEQAESALGISSTGPLTTIVETGKQEVLPQEAVKHAEKPVKKSKKEKKKGFGAVLQSFFAKLFSRRKKKNKGLPEDENFQAQRLNWINRSLGMMNLHRSKALNANDSRIVKQETEAEIRAIDLVLKCAEELEEHGYSHDIDIRAMKQRKIDAEQRLPKK